ncbi:MAG: asparagine synthetase A [Bacillota bacterium]
MTTSVPYLEFLSSDQAQTIFRISQRVMSSLREYLNNQGFVEFLPPVISTVTDPGLRGAERVSVSLYGQKAYVTSSMVFHKQVLATVFGKIYSFAPNVRLEPVSNDNSGRHLVEFCQLDLEEAGSSCEESMALAEEMIASTVQDVVEHCQEPLGRLLRCLSIPTIPFARFTYDELLHKALSMGLSVRYGEELPQEVETRVSEELGTFFWITDYPKLCRGFYYREAADPRIVRSMDLIYPDGFGEAISGGEREYLPATIRRRIEEHQLSPLDFEPFLTYAESGLKPTSGFGIGFERLLRYITGIRDISLIRPFPKIPGRVVM